MNRYFMLLLELTKDAYSLYLYPVHVVCRKMEVSQGGRFFNLQNFAAIFPQYLINRIPHAKCFPSLSSLYLDPFQSIQMDIRVIMAVDMLRMWNFIC